MSSICCLNDPFLFRNVFALYFENPTWRHGDLAANSICKLNVFPRLALGALTRLRNDIAFWVAASKRTKPRRTQGESVHPSFIYRWIDDKMDDHPSVCTSISFGAPSLFHFFFNFLCWPMGTVHFFSFFLSFFYVKHDILRAVGQGPYLRLQDHMGRCSGVIEKKVK